MINIIEAHITRSIDCSHIASANLLHELVMLRDGLLMLPEWFTRDNIQCESKSSPPPSKFLVIFSLMVSPCN